MDEVAELYQLIESYARRRLEPFEKERLSRPFRVELMKSILGMPNRAKDEARSDAEQNLVDAASGMRERHQNMRAQLDSVLAFKYSPLAQQTEKTILLRDVHRKLENRRNG